MSKTALITGASGGIGYELCKLFARDGYDLIIVARSADKMEKLKTDLNAQHGTRVLCIAADLCAESTAEHVFETVNAMGHRVDVLVNNAGFGDSGAYVQCDWAKQQSMVQLNILALMQLTRLFLPGMVKRGQGKIMNIASIAAFQPGPYMSAYYASKAFVLSFSEALSAELKDSDVFVTAVCPGPVNTGFESAASAQRLFATIKAASAGDIASFAYRAMQRNKVVATPGVLFKVMHFAERLVPRSLVRNIVARMQRP